MIRARGNCHDIAQPVGDVRLAIVKVGAHPSPPDDGPVAAQRQAVNLARG